MSTLHINVNQQESIIEYNVPPSLINKLYKLVNRENNGETIFDNNTNIIGTINTEYTYEEYINIIKNRFNQLHINADGYYILFEDENSKQILFNAINWTEEGITAEQAANINLIASNTKISGTSIIYFNEFKYFTSNSGLTDLFKNCTSLKEVTMPPIVASWARGYYDHSPFYNCSSLTKVNWNNCTITGGDKYRKYFGLYNKCSSIKWYDGILPPGCDEISEHMFNNSGVEKIIAPEGITCMGAIVGATKCVYIELPTTVTEIDAQHWGRNMNERSGGTGQIVLACKAITPPTLLRTDGFHDADTTIYVPDELISEYQTAWSNFPRLSGIYGLSELPQTYKDMGTIK